MKIIRKAIQGDAENLTTIIRLSAREWHEIITPWPKESIYHPMPLDVDRMSILEIDKILHEKREIANLCKHGFA